MKYALMALKKYAVFSGRSRRSEYWYFILFSTIISFILTFVDLIISQGTQMNFVVFQALFGLFVVIPGLAVLVRRLHDIGKSGWWMLILLIPIGGYILLLVWLATNSQPGVNQYGPNPKESNQTSTQANTLPIENNFTRPTSPIVSASVNDITPPTTPTSNLS